MSRRSNKFSTVWVQLRSPSAGPRRELWLAEIELETGLNPTAEFVFGTRCEICFDSLDKRACFRTVEEEAGRRKERLYHLKCGRDRVLDWIRDYGSQIPQRVLDGFWERANELAVMDAIAHGDSEPPLEV